MSLKRISADITDENVRTGQVVFINEEATDDVVLIIADDKYYVVERESMEEGLGVGLRELLDFMNLVPRVKYVLFCNLPLTTDEPCFKSWIERLRPAIARDPFSNSICFVIDLYRGDDEKVGNHLINFLLKESVRADHIAVLSWGSLSENLNTDFVRLKKQSIKEAWESRPDELPSELRHLFQMEVSGATVSAVWSALQQKGYHDPGDVARELDNGRDIGRDLQQVSNQDESGIIRWTLEEITKELKNGKTNREASLPYVCAKQFFQYSQSLGFFAAKGVVNVLARRYGLEPEDRANYQRFLTTDRYDVPVLGTNIYAVEFYNGLDNLFSTIRKEENEPGRAKAIRVSFKSGGKYAEIRIRFDGGLRAWRWCHERQDEEKHRLRSALRRLERCVSPSEQRYTCYLPLGLSSEFAQEDCCCITDDNSVVIHLSEKCSNGTDSD